MLGPDFVYVELIAQPSIQLHPWSETCAGQSRLAARSGLLRTSVRAAVAKKFQVVASHLRHASLQGPQSAGMQVDLRWCGSVPFTHDPVLS